MSNPTVWKELPAAQRHAGAPSIDLVRPPKGAPKLKFRGGAHELVGLEKDARMVIALEENSRGCGALALRPARDMHEGRPVRKYGNCQTLEISYSGLALITASFARVRYKARRAAKHEAPWVIILEPVESER